jgi:ribosomal protein L22
MSPEKPAAPGQGKPAGQEQIEAEAAEATEKTAAARSERKRPRIRRKGADKASAAGAVDEAAGAVDEAAGGEAEAEAAPAAKAAEKAPAAKAAEEPAEQASEKKPRARAGRGEEKPAEGAVRARASAKPAARSGRTSGKRARRRVVRARARYVRTSARKARMVCVHLRGKTVPEARAILAFTPREVARDWSKLLESAIANAENNHELLEDDLIVREAYADEGPTIKRFRPRAMGRATPIHKRTSHLTITLTSGE